MKLSYSLSPCTNINSKWITDPNISYETINYIEENADTKLTNLALKEDVINSTTKARGVKAEINEWDSVKLESFCAAKETTKKTERQASQWEEILANNSSDKGLISKIHKGVTQLNTG